MTKDEKFAKARTLVDGVVEPKVKEVVAALNKTLEKYNVRAGVELQWFFEEVKDEKALEVVDVGSGRTPVRGS